MTDRAHGRGCCRELQLLWNRLQRCAVGVVGAVGVIGVVGVVGVVGEVGEVGVVGEVGEVGAVLFCPALHCAVAVNCQLWRNHRSDQKLAFYPPPSLHWLVAQSYR